MVRSGFGKRFPARESAMAKVLAANVRRFRQAKGLTQDALATNADIKQQSLSLIENARANPTISTVENIAATLGVTFLDLFAAIQKTKRSRDA